MGQPPGCTPRHVSIPGVPAPLAAPMTATALLAFWAVAILLILTPGADWAYAIAAGIRGRGILTSVTGLILGHLTMVTVVAIGAGAMLNAHPSAMSALTYAGAIYLMVLGVRISRNPPVPTAEDGEQATSARRWLVGGWGVSALNPKVFLLFLALLPQFVLADSPLSPGMQMLLLGIVEVATCMVVYLAVGYGAKAILGSRPAAARWVGRVSGVLMVVVGVLLVVHQARHLAWLLASTRG